MRARKVLRFAIGCMQKPENMQSDIALGSRLIQTVSTEQNGSKNSSPIMFYDRQNNQCTYHATLFAFMLHYADVKPISVTPLLGTVNYSHSPYIKDYSYSMFDVT